MSKGQRDRGSPLTVAAFAADRGLGTGPALSSARSCLWELFINAQYALPWGASVLAAVLDGAGILIGSNTKEQGTGGNMLVEIRNCQERIWWGWDGGGIREGLTMCVCVCRYVVFASKP